MNEVLTYQHIAARIRSTHTTAGISYRPSLRRCHKPYIHINIHIHTLSSKHKLDHGPAIHTHTHTHNLTHTHAYTHTHTHTHTHTRTNTQKQHTEAIHRSNTQKQHTEAPHRSTTQKQRLDNQRRTCRADQKAKEQAATRDAVNRVKADGLCILDGPAGGLAGGWVGDWALLRDHLCRWGGQVSFCVFRSDGQFTARVEMFVSLPLCGCRWYSFVLLVLSFFFPRLGQSSRRMRARHTWLRHELQQPQHAQPQPQPLPTLLQHAQQ